MNVANELSEAYNQAFTAFLTWAMKLEDPIARRAIEQALIGIERRVQDIDDPDLTKSVSRILRYWLYMAKGEKDRMALSADSICKVMIQMLDFVLIRGEVSTESRMSALQLLLPQPPLNWEEIEVFEIEGTVGSVKIGTIKMAAAESANDATVVLRAPGDTSETLDITLVFRGDAPPASDVGILLFAFSELFTLVEGAEIRLVDVGRGSFWIRVRVSCRGFFRRKEVKDLLINARDAVEAKYLKKEIEEVAKIKAERQKIDVERESLESQLAEKKAAPDPIEAQLKILELKERVARLRALELDNAGKTLDLKIKVVGMIREGMLSAEPVDIFVEDSLLLRAQDGQITKGSDLPKKLDVPPPDPTGRAEGAVA